MVIMIFMAFVIWREAHPNILIAPNIEQLVPTLNLVVLHRFCGHLWAVLGWEVQNKASGLLGRVER